MNCYLRSLRTFFSWLTAEEIIRQNPFQKVNIPKPPRKLIPTFSDDQPRHLLAAADTSTPTGCRDYRIMVTLLDTAIRVSELCTIRMDNLFLEDDAFLLPFIEQWFLNEYGNIVLLWRLICCPLRQKKPVINMPGVGRLKAVAVAEIPIPLVYSYCSNIATYLA